MTPEQEICIKCQECCRWLTFILDDAIIEEFEEVYKHRGCIIKKIEGVNSTALLVPSICPHLTVMGCAIYEQRPNDCAEYDGRNDPFMKDRCQLPKGE